MIYHISETPLILKILFGKSSTVTTFTYNVSNKFVFIIY